MTSQPTTITLRRRHLASQPKIVDGGALVTGGLDFDGVDDQLDANSLAASFSGTDSPISAFSVSQSDIIDNISNIFRFANSTITNALKALQYRDGGKYGFIYRSNDGVNANLLALDNYAAFIEYQHSLIIPSNVVNIWENSSNIFLVRQR